MATPERPPLRNLANYLLAAGLFGLIPYGLGVYGEDATLQPWAVAAGAAVAIAASMISTKAKGRQWWWELTHAQRQQRARANQAAERAYYQKLYEQGVSIRARTEKEIAAGRPVWGPRDYIFWGIFAFLWLSMFF